MNRSSFLKTLGALCVAPLVAAKAVADSSAVNPISRLAAVDTRFAVSSADLAAALERAGASAREAGISFERLNEIVTRVHETTGRGGAVIGNSLKTVFRRMHRTETYDLLHRLGIQTDGRLTVEILDDIQRAWPTLSQASQNALAEQLGGVYQINCAKAAFMSWSPVRT